MGLLSAGRYTYGQEHIERRGSDNNITIGAFTSIAINCVCDGGFQHNISFISTFPFKARKGWGSIDVEKCNGDIVIGNDVWIGEGVMIMSGVTIGDGAIIGARTIVTKDVQPYSVVVGAPMRFLRYRYTNDVVKKLLEIKWWNWSDENIKENSDLLNSKNIQEFIEQYENKK